MLFSKMVSGLICSKNLKKSKTPKSNGRTVKNKNSMPKPNNSKKFLSDSTLATSNAEQQNEEQGSNGKSSTEPKVKSGSWKRSEKKLSSCHTVASSTIKVKARRKRSPNWIALSSPSIAQTDEQDASNCTSQCRPGTLYSDVLFGAGGLENNSAAIPSVVKIKMLTPRRNCPCSSNGTSAHQLQIANSKKIARKKTLLKRRSCRPIDDVIKENPNNRRIKESFPPLAGAGGDPKVTSPYPTSDTGTSSGADDDDVVIISDISEISYGSYLEDHGYNKAMLSVLNNNSNKTSKPLRLDVQQWNFTDLEKMDHRDFPKFLCQFDDKNYLNAEMMALLGLKLALGNNGFGFAG